MLNQSEIKMPENLVKIFKALDQDGVMEQFKNIYEKMNSYMFNDSKQEYYLSFFKTSVSEKFLLPALGIDRDKLIEIFMLLHTQKVATRKFDTLPIESDRILFVKNRNDLTRIKDYSKLKFKPIETRQVLSDVYTKEGFMSHRMYTDPNYLVNLVFIMYGVWKTKDEGGISIVSQDAVHYCTKSAIMHIFARVMNGRMKRYYPRGHDPVVAKQVQKNLSNSFDILKNNDTPTDVILYRYLPDTLDYLNDKESKKYLNTSPHEIIYIFSRFWNKVSDALKRVTNVYMKTIREKKITQTQKNSDIESFKQEVIYISNETIKSIRMNIGVPNNVYTEMNPRISDKIMSKIINNVISNLEPTYELIQLITEIFLKKYTKTYEDTETLKRRLLARQNNKVILLCNEILTGITITKPLSREFLLHVILTIMYSVIIKSKLKFISVKQESETRTIKIRRRKI